MRDNLYRLHKWIGLSLALLIAFQALTGLSLVFKDELLVAFNRELLAGPRASAPPAVAEALQALQRGPYASLPVERIVYPAGARTSLVLYLNEIDSNARRIVAADAASGRILGEIRGAGSLPYTMFALHDELAIGTTGRWLILVAGAGVFFF